MDFPNPLASLLVSMAGAPASAVLSRLSALPRPELPAVANQFLLARAGGLPETTMHCLATAGPPLPAQPLAAALPRRLPPTVEMLAVLLAASSKKVCLRASLVLGSGGLFGDLHTCLVIARLIK